MRRWVVLVAVLVAMFIAPSASADPPNGSAEPQDAPPPHVAAPEGDAPPERGPATIDLFPAEAFGRTIDEPPSIERESEERVDRWMHDQFEQERIDVGLVDGWYSTLRVSMEGAFRPTSRDLDGDRGRMDAPERVLHELGRFVAPRQQPIDPRGQAPATLFGHDQSAYYSSRADQAMAQQLADQLNPHHAPVTWYAADVRVRHDRDGRPVRVELIASSGMSSIDRAAVQAARHAAQRITQPPARVIGERAFFVSEWRFRVGDVATFLNSMGVAGDQPYGLGRGFVRRSISLIRVIDDQHPTFEERRAQEEAARDERPADAR